MGAGRAGRIRKLSDEQLAKVEVALLAWLKANGFPTEMWTLARVAEVIEKVTGVQRRDGSSGWSVRRGLGTGELGQAR